MYNSEYYANNPADIDVSGVTGNATAVQFPTGTVKLLKFKARASNQGSFFIGETPNDLHFELDAGDLLEVEITNLNQLYYSNPSGTSDFLAYWRQY
jgi:hypothetical protein